MFRNIELQMISRFGLRRSAVALGIALTVSACTYDGYRLAKRQECQSMAIDYERNRCLSKWGGDRGAPYRKAKQEDRNF